MLGGKYFTLYITDLTPRLTVKDRSYEVNDVGFRSRGLTPMPSKNPSRRKPRVPAAGYDKVCIIILTDRTYVNMLYGDTMRSKVPGWPWTPKTKNYLSSNDVQLVGLHLKGGREAGYKPIRRRELVATHRGP